MIEIINGALDEQGDQVIIRGSISSESLSELLVDEYQREILPGQTISKIMEGFQSGIGVPDIVLGMRGLDVEHRRGGKFLISSPVYIIDGQQRVSAAKKLIFEGGTPRLGALIYLETTKEKERELFRTLNADRTRVSPDVLLRNLHDNFHAVAALMKICIDSKNVLDGRVCWQQRKNKRHLFTATTLLRTLVQLHGHIESQGARKTYEQSEKLEKIYGVLGKKIFCENILTFFNTIEDVWGISTITVNATAAQVKQGFLAALAKLFSHHSEFWNGQSLVMDDRYVKRLKSFKLTDPTIQSLASSGGMGLSTLYAILVQHVNGGRNKLTER